MRGDELEPGGRDELVTVRLRRLLDALGHDGTTAALDDAEVAGRLARHLAEIAGRSLENRDPGARVGAANGLIAGLGAARDDGNDQLADHEPDHHQPGDDEVVAPARVLTYLGPAADSVAPPLPAIPLSQHDLLVNARGEPQLASELKKELASADRVDLIVAFVRWYGVRLLFDELTAAIRRGVPVRLLTTTYTGSTERRALDELTAIGVEVRVSYDTQMTRLHAKSFVFHRDSGFGTAFVGSSNLTRTALLDGREWNVRLSRSASPQLFEKVATAFEAQWESGDYEDYDPDRFTAAIQADRAPDDGESVLSGLQLRAWPYQDEILDAVTVEREVHGSTRNLVVAPTGTGKTVVAALDYLRLRAEHGDLSLLFVAHREQILRQSRRTFREALRDGAFGEMLVGGHRPEDGRHVFASIQTLHAGGSERFAPDAFDVVIVDEFHHAEAATYQALLDHLEPRFLLALTATPERTDGLDIRRWTDGRTAFDMRLWHALDRQLLAPFQYFGLADVADLDHVRWQGGRYNAEDLERVYTGDDARARLIVTKVRHLVTDPQQMRALGFCATVAHAHDMARVFNRAGWNAMAIDGTSPQHEREHAVSELRAGRLTTIFTRDVFNEGVDIPEVDTILLLRPTESVTVHLQQIGRGLRRHPDKDVCTIIDLVAQHRREYRFDLRLRALTGISRRELQEAAEEGFPYLPSGCHLELDRQAREWVLQHLKEAARTNRTALRKELTLLATQQADRRAPTLRAFLEDSGIELEDVAKAGGWTRLKRDADLEPREASRDETQLQRGVRRLLHVDDTARLDRWHAWLSADAAPVLATEADRRLAWMLLVTVWGLRAAPDTLDAAWTGLWQAAPLREELAETFVLLRERIPRPVIPLPDADVPLRLHATYARDEILSAFGRLAPGERYALRMGPWWHEPAMTEVLFITLQKTAKHYSPTTLYRDYAISRNLFHWESQNTTRVESTAGQRYLQQRSNGVRVLLAVRASRTDPWGATRAYTLLGPAHYVSHQGEQPIAITWRLDNPIPADLYEDFKVAAA